MKKLYSLTIATSLVAVLSGCTNSPSAPAAKMALPDVKSECNVEANGIEKVLMSAEKYNAIAKKEGVEFMRLGMKASQYIESTKAAVASGSKTIDVVDKKGKKTGELSTEYAAWRSCSFAVSALTQAEEAKTTWRLAAPGDGYKY